MVLSPKAVHLTKHWFCLPCVYYQKIMAAHTDGTMFLPPGGPGWDGPLAVLEPVCGPLVQLCCDILDGITHETQLADVRSLAPR